MLKQKTPLKRNSTLKQKTPLKAKTALKVKCSLQQKTALNAVNSIQKKERNTVTDKAETNKVAKKAHITKTSKKKESKKSYWSIFTEDMNKCVITGATKESGAIIDPHHIFGASDKNSSEKYGFMIPLRRDWHETANYSIHMNVTLSNKYKLLCQDYWINVLHKTKDEFRKKFRMWYVEKGKSA